MTDERLASIETKLDGLASVIEDTRTEMRALHDETHAEMHALHDQARHEARVLHEEALSRIADSAPDFGAIERKIKRGDAEVRESLEPRIEALETAERARRRPKH
jgi:hypothetical protein